MIYEVVDSLMKGYEGLKHIRKVRKNTQDGGLNMRPDTPGVTGNPDRGTSPNAGWNPNDTDDQRGPGGLPKPR